MDKQSKKDIESLIMAALVGCCIFGTAYARADLAGVIVYSAFTVICVGMYSMQDWEVSP